MRANQHNVTPYLHLVALAALTLPVAANAVDRSEIREGVKARIEQRSSESSATGREGGLRERVQAKRNRGDTASSAKIEKIAGLDVAVWEPAAAASAPLVIFSHGFSGCNTQSTFLMEAMAAAGYLVVAPNHKDNNCGKPPMGKPEEKFNNPEAWTDQTYKD